MQPIFPKEKPDRLPFDRPPASVINPYTPSSNVQSTSAVSVAPVVLTWKQSLVAGGLSRGAAVTSMFPVDTVKTRLQMATASGLKEVLKPPYYAGYNAAICSQIPYGMAVFGTYETAKVALLEKYPNQNRLVLFFGAAALGDLVGSTVLTPGEVLKQKVQAGQHKDVLSAAKSIFKERGFRGFYQGYSSLVARDLPFRAIQLPLYESLKTWYADKRLYGDVDAISPPVAAVLGAGAGMTGAALTNPIDVIKTQMMCGDGKSNPIAAIRAILKERPLALLNGMPQRVGFLGGSSAVFFIMYEFVRGTISGGITLDMDILG